jgi:hypothetical protein
MWELDVSQQYGALRPVTGIVYVYCYQMRNVHGLMGYKVLVCVCVLWNSSLITIFHIYSHDVLKKYSVVLRLITK